MEFMIGCNYWASNAGTEMWRNFDAAIIENDLKILRSYGIKYLRVFPNWRDFQPVEKRQHSTGNIVRYAIDSDELNDGGYYIEEEMMKRFSIFLDICEKYDIKVIIGLLTGFMSGGLFVPPALIDENLITSPNALYFEQLFIRGFVKRFKDRDSIFAWDFGNECNNLSRGAKDIETGNWVALISNSIRAEDPTRPVLSGMAYTSVSENWNFRDMGMFCDMITTHPYPYWSRHTKIDDSLSVRTLMCPTTQTKMAASVSKKPCLIEETGTMGPMITSDENSALFARLCMFAGWANGSTGYLWWCANEQTNLYTFPYTDQMVEQELGLLRCDFTPKPVILEMDKFAKWQESLDFELPKAKQDAVCILTRNQDTWGIGYMTSILSTLAGINCSFCYADYGIPESDLYIMPSFNYSKVMHKNRYEELKKRVFEGADLYLSVELGVLSEFESLSGLKILDSYEYAESGSAIINGKEINFTKARNYIFEPKTAEVLAYDDKGNPFFTFNKYGKGRIFFVNAPIESNLLPKHNAFSGNERAIYDVLAEKVRASYPVKVLGEDIVMTYHPDDNGGYVVLLNYYKDEKDFSLELNEGYSVEKVYYGENGKINPFDACVIKLKKC